MSRQSRILVTAAVISLISVAGSVAVSNASTREDCIYQATAAGNGHTVYTNSSGTLIPSGTLTTGQQADLLATAITWAAPDGDAVLPVFIRQHMLFPVTSASGVVLMVNTGDCAIDR